MTPSQQYDAQIEEIADRFREVDAVDMILYDVKLLRQSINLSINQEVVENLIEQVEKHIQKDESFEYILQNIPDDVKRLML